MDFGHQVTCVDKVGDKIAALRHGEILVFEPDLSALVRQEMAKPVVVDLRDPEGCFFSKRSQ
jgi:UDP-glucose 6-dehydrogenase